MAVFVKVRQMTIFNLGLLILRMNGSVFSQTQGAIVTEQDREKTAVIAVVQHFVDAWNLHDMGAFASIFSEDADFVNVIGQRWIGREAIKKAHAANHATLFKLSHLSIQDISVRFLKPDIAVLRCIPKLSGQLDHAGRILPPRYTILTFIMMKAGGEWPVVVAQNTNIDTNISLVDP
jgi:uncharacterized protein (TIGR02246 family)